MFNKKKAQVQGFSIVVVLIVFLVSAGILLLFVGQMSGVVRDSGKIQTCQLSIIAASKIKISSPERVGIDSRIIDTINCPYQVVEIKKKDVLAKNDALDWEKVNAIFAQELYDCYTKTGGGEYNPFGVGQEGSVCVICSRIDTSEIKEYNLLGSKIYLATKNVPGASATFHEIVYGSAPDSELLNSLVQNFENNQDVMKLSEDYVVIWKVVPSPIQDAIKKSPNPLLYIGGVVKRFLGEDLFYHTYDVVPVSDLSRVIAIDNEEYRYCDSLIEMRK